MSQDKVNRYKEEKAKRKEVLAKEKSQKMVRRLLAAVLGVAIIGWVGYSAVELYQASRPREMVEIDYTAMEEYMKTLTE